MHLKLFNHQSSENTRVLGIEKSCHHTQFTIRRSDSSWKTADLGRIFNLSYLTYGNCNGLMLMMNFFTEEMILWNPFTRKSLILPPCPLGSVDNMLGFAPSNNEYKVIACRFKYINGVRSSEVGIASFLLNDNQWKIKPKWTNVWSWDSLKYGPRRVFCGGILYWIGHDPRLSQKTHHLLYVNFEVEKFSVMQLPEAAKESIVKFLFVLGESLAIFAMSCESSCIWVLEKDVGEDPWRLWFLGDPDLNACELFKSVTTGYPFSKILYVQKSNAFLMVEEIERDGTIKYQPISYNIRSHKLQVLKKPIRNEIYLDTCVESLVLHKGFEGQTSISFP
ncbi:uncharacterized protein [Spinacia oleracea]|uniref:Uncharacterized protein isoform X3 n=1 Tax=Spinacia oleracea TaxID=3562 RepID=A0ABM3QL05_SPIOL|nr:uncharacterized protein LOC110788137 isoform X3 [Spinacia oleracea]XP_056684049.1 uncharacterized protein LOC110788137 isoform X3 [Spinacia oleracea]